MRLGYLGRLSDLPLNGQMLGSHPGIPSDLHRAGHPAGGKMSYNFKSISTMSIGANQIFCSRIFIS